MSAIGRHVESGQTLLEMLVVLGIMALVAGLVFPLYRQPLERFRLTSAHAELAGTLRAARATAMREDRIVAVAIADNDRGYALGNREHELARTFIIQSSANTVTFFPDGTSTGGTMTVGSPRDRRPVRVDPVSGIVETVVRQ